MFVIDCAEARPVTLCDLRVWYLGNQVDSAEGNDARSFLCSAVWDDVGQ